MEGTVGPLGVQWDFIFPYIFSNNSLAISLNYNIFVNYLYGNSETAKIQRRKFRKLNQIQNINCRLLNSTLFHRTRMW